jgi:hypothetical protein
MTTFAAYASSFRFLQNPSITDVATIITDFRSETVTNGSPAWTEPTSQNFKSPVDANGRFFTVILTRTTATRLAFKVTDQSGVTVCDREIDISGTAIINYYTGQFHAFVETVLGESAYGGILDASPLTQGSYTIYVYGTGTRNNAGTVDAGNDTTGKIFMIDNGTSAVVQRTRALGVNAANTTVGLTDLAGNMLYYPVEVMTNVAGNIRWNGRMYQTFYTDALASVGSLKTISIGTAGETGVFKVLGGGMASVEFMRFAVRVS